MEGPGVSNDLELDSRSVVDVLGEYTSSCGYCESANGSVSYGLLTKRLQPQDYQDLIDRGWRRCGNMCYKPVMNRTCCPQYTIRCSAREFKLSKSQKKVLKRMSTFLHGGLSLIPKGRGSESMAEDESPSAKSLPEELKQIVQRKKDASRNLGALKMPTDENAGVYLDNVTSDLKAAGSSANTFPNVPGGTTTCVKAEFPRKKAKLIRLENKLMKLRKNSVESTTPKTPLDRSKRMSEKTLEVFILENEAAPALEVKLLLSASLSPEEHKEEWEIYRKYEMAIHRQPEDETDLSSFMEFLVNSPLLHCSPEGSPSFGYGSFHQQYRLNGKLIAVGVLDILPLCVSSVYFFYDPEYSRLSLGTYGCLREITLTRFLSEECSELQYYYLGYYIHSCDKMRYKKNFSPSYLLCPEQFTWHPSDKSIPKIDVNKYCRLDESTTNYQENVDYDKVSCWISFLGELMSFQVYKSVNQSIPPSYSCLLPAAQNEIDEYIQFVGKKCAESMIVVL